MGSAAPSPRCSLIGRGQPPSAQRSTRRVNACEFVYLLCCDLHRDKSRIRSLSITSLHHSHSRLHPRIRITSSNAEFCCECGQALGGYLPALEQVTYLDSRGSSIFRTHSCDLYFNTKSLQAHFHLECSSLTVTIASTFGSGPD